LKAGVVVKIIEDGIGTQEEHIKSVIVERFIEPRESLFLVSKAEITCAMK
jgi:hypothetical protein